MSKPGSILIKVSRVADGTMSGNIEDQATRTNRQSFLSQHGVAVERSALVRLTYGGADYTRYKTVKAEFAGDGLVRPSSVTADAIFTKQANLALFLPLADCIGMVIYNKQQTAFGVSHLGRHNLLQDGGLKSINYFIDTFGIKHEYIRVYLSPAAGKSAYRIYDLAGKGLHEAALEQLARAKIDRDNIKLDDQDTTGNGTFFSHSEYKKGNRPTDGRHALVAMLRSTQ